MRSGSSDNTEHGARVRAGVAGSVVWADIDGAVMGLPDVTGAETNSLVLSFTQCARGEAFLAWTQFQMAAELHARLVEPFADEDDHTVDVFAQCAARIAIGQAISQRGAEQLLSDAVALRDRLPRVSTCLRDGLLTRRQTSTIISRTALAEDQDYAAEADAVIAAELRSRAGVWSLRAIRDLADRIMFRFDPAAVRERRDRALADRAVWVDEDAEGMAVLSASMSAENARIAIGRVRALAKCACSGDPRSVRARNSDAAFALLSGTAFECLCGRADCAAQIPAPGGLPPEVANLVIHVVCDARTLDDPTDTTPGVLDGYGVISADHVRELADRADAMVHHLNLNDTGPHDLDTRDRAASTPTAAQPETPEYPSGTGRSETASEGSTTDNRGVNQDDARPLNSGAECETAEAASADLASAEPATTKSSRVSGVGGATGAVDRGSDPDAKEQNFRHRSSQVVEPPGEASTGIEPHGIAPAFPDVGTETASPAAQPSNSPPGLRPHLRSNPYRPSAALSVFLRARDMTCAVPGCTKPAFGCDLDHVREFDHTNPSAGGQTEPAGMNAKCRFHHLLKTFGDFVDDQVIVDGRPQTTFITPEGLILPGRADSGMDVIEALATIRFRPADTTTNPRTIRDGDEPPRRPAPRTTQRHARREQERRRNRERRAAEQQLRRAQEAAAPPPPY